MMKGIVLKLFVLTTILCMLIVAIIYIGQTVFFERFYANKKVDNIKTNIQSFEKKYIEAQGNAQVIQQLKQEFYQEHTTFITALDSVGNIKYKDDFYTEVRINSSEESVFSNQILKIPLYSFVNVEDIKKLEGYFLEKNAVSITGIIKGSVIVPVELYIRNNNKNFENRPLFDELFRNGEPMVKSAVKPQVQYQEGNKIVLVGQITKVQIPEGNVPTNFIYRNQLFIDRVKDFQSKLIRNIEFTEDYNYEENGVKYKLFIKPIKDIDGTTTYIFAMTSLQPVNEAVQMIKEYYIYLIILVVILIVLASFYYSKKIAKPLLQINDTTKKIANLDFSEEIVVTSKDEIGDLSHNINTLSGALSSHINQLREDIEKEKQLENTRKEFIAGVSHELKTPLSIMKSCMSILKDGVASHKRDYYFEAMEKEVDKMDMLIVDMLELAKFESGTYHMKKDVFSIDEVIRCVCEQLSLEIEMKRLRMYKQFANVDVYANQNRIEQVITNFITNAIRYTPEGEKVIVSTLEEEHIVKVCVENKGAHILEEHLDKIWDRFYRGDASRQRSKGGTGLGLAISKNILELHGVNYGVTNTEDGVLFFFYLNKNV
ncbi:sensor histidine kinase [Priestia taiwanensis]|uniref:histidine kinase n=1 Tax=Priestia taiwanensis TaxID=1347902 RepID=A0A917EMM3_9BACI|nr:HAMP domain-containing sensor histidine kinase [Priestia taiwanensis]MBM7362389.1 signal transduction histidine kinase [Priestia taiwanensis]GGE61813.1 two-component sensor histidine kinase [Priestia taiwanensis]